jgi:hypothetical protein
LFTCVLVLGAGCLPPAFGHPHRAPHRTPNAAATAAAVRPDAASGQGTWRFRVRYTSSHLPKEALPFLGGAHGGFAVDERAGRGEVYFALKGAGIVRLSGDLKRSELLPTPGPLKKTNLHNTTVWYDDAGTAYLVFPANDSGQVFTTTTDGRLLHTLSSPSPGDRFDSREVNDYFRDKGSFAPTDVEYLNGLYYVTTGYSKLDYVLTGRVETMRAFSVLWHTLAFGGKGSTPGRLDTGHGITVAPGRKQLAVSDRPNSRISRFDPGGRHLSDLALPLGSWPCDIQYLDKYAVVGCLHGPDRGKGAPIYILEGDRVVSIIMPREELGLANFRHVHNAVLKRAGGRFYIIAQSWNPGDFAVLEQVRE